MYKYLFPAVVIALFYSCSSPAPHHDLADSLHTADTSLKTIKPAMLIVPGKRIGSITLNANADSLPKTLGEPDFADGAMGASLLSWDTHVGKAIYETSVYSHRNMGAADENISHIKKIRVTSPAYKTADYVGPGSELKDMMKLYKLKQKTPAVKTSEYDDYNAGIGFEVDSTGRCTAVLVYAKGDSSNAYISMRH